VCKWETLSTIEPSLALETIFEGVNIYMNPAHIYCVSLYMTCGVKLSEPSLSDSHHSSPSYLSLTVGPTMAEIRPSSPEELFSSVARFPSTQNNRKWDIAQTVTENYK
jgi:hypothetical protein